jgi:hypothetical protein
MSDLLDFAARLIELEGGVVEPHAEGLVALLPAHLGAAWSAPEELLLSAAEGAPARLSYGSELLERMIGTATSDLPMTWVRADVPQVRTGQVRHAAEQWSLRNGVTSVGEIRVGPQVRVWVDAMATLQGDEKRELLVSAALSHLTGTEVLGFEDMVGGLLSASEAPALVDDGRLDQALRACAARAEVLAAGFRAGMTRRFERDRERIEHYFEDLLAELDKRAAKGKLDQATVRDKRTALLQDRAVKLEALSARFVLRIEVAPVALRVVHVDGAFATVTLRRRKSARTIELEYDAATKRFVAPMCEGCGRAAAKPAACDEAVHLLCEVCVPRTEGRVSCPACLRTRSAERRSAAAQV